MNIPIPSINTGSDTNGPIKILLVEDDAADAMLVESLLDNSEIFQLSWIKSLEESIDYVNKVDCVLLDLGLPGAIGLEALHLALGIMGETAIVVLTGLTDELRGEAAVGAGAQDYLVKGRVDGELLTRSIVYAVQRQRSEENEKLLSRAELLREHNARLERGLLPHPNIEMDSIRLTTWYRAGADQALVGGDFYDAFEGPDGELKVIIGDVSGHGPDEAALGVTLRAAWRALVLSGVNDRDVFPVLNKMITTERPNPEMYTTACMATVSADRSQVRLLIAGHPSPLLLSKVSEEVGVSLGPALGIFDQAHWPVTEIECDPEWKLLLYTDGIIEGRRGRGRERLDIEGLIDLADICITTAQSSDEILHELVTAAEVENGGQLVDDVAMVLVEGVLN